MNSQELSNFLERVRRGRKITQEDFVDGICSLRQYQRYRRGESEIPYERVDLFAERLGIKTRKLMNQFEAAKNKQTEQVNNYYNAIVTGQKKLIDKYRKMIEKDIIIDSEIKLYYEHAKIYDDYYRNRIDKSELISKNAELINYPDVLKQQYFSDIEVLILSSLLPIKDIPKIDLLLNRLGELFEDQSYIMSGSTVMTYSLILMRLAEAHGMRGEFEKVIEFCSLAIERATFKKFYYLFEYFYYFKALAHFRLEEYREYEDALFRCYNVLHMEGTQEKIDHFTELIEKDFNINYHMFIMKYLKKEIM